MNSRGAVVYGKVLSAFELSIGVPERLGTGDQDRSGLSTVTVARAHHFLEDLSCFELSTVDFSPVTSHQSPVTSSIHHAAKRFEGLARQ